MNREQLIVELTNLNPNENRQDVEDELMPLIDEYAKRVALEERIDELEALEPMLNYMGDQVKVNKRIAELKAQQEEV